MTETGAEVAVRPAGHLAVRPEQSHWTPEQRTALRHMGIADDAPEADLSVFLTVAQRTGLDPFARQIYMIKRAGKYGIQTGIDGFRVVAQRTGRYGGQTAQEWQGRDGVWREVWLDDEPPAAARVGVFIAGVERPVYATAMFREYAATFWDSQRREQTLTQMWAKMPALMLSKCAEALALRKAFPQDLAGVYVAEEMTASRTIEADPAGFWLANIETCESRADLRQLWVAARDAGELTPAVADALSERALALEDDHPDDEPAATEPAATEPAAAEPAVEILDSPPGGSDGW